jgi:hypothetical protein
MEKMWLTAQFGTLRQSLSLCPFEGIEIHLEIVSLTLDDLKP